MKLFSKLFGNKKEVSSQEKSVLSIKPIKTAVTFDFIYTVEVECMHNKNKVKVKVTTSKSDVAPKYKCSCGKIITLPTPRLTKYNVSYIHKEVNSRGIRLCSDKHSVNIDSYQRTCFIDDEYNIIEVYENGSVRQENVF